MTRSPLLLPTLGLALGIGIGLAGVPFPRAALGGLALGLSPPLAPVACALAGWLGAEAGRAEPGAPATAVVLSGRIASVPDRFAERVRFRLRADDGRLVDVFAAPTPWPLALGDRVRLRAELRRPAGARNPGGRDPAYRLAASGVAVQGIATGPVVRLARPSPAAHLEAARERFAAAATRLLPARESAVVRAIGTGDRGALDPGTTESFARSGLAHVLAVSGYHLVVVVLGLERLLRAILLRIEAVAARTDARRVSAAITLPLAVVYALATGAGPPVLRAAVAAGVVLGATLLAREADPLNTLALAAFALLAGDPASALDAGLQLSFAAVAGLLLWAGPFRRALPLRAPAPGSWRARLLEPFLSGACATLAAALATAPVLAYHFRQLPLLGLAANVAAIPVGAGLTVVAALGAVAAAIAPVLAAPLLLAAWPLATALLTLSDLAAAPSWAVYGLASPGAAGAIAAAALAFVAGLVRPAPLRVLAALSAAACLLLPGPLRAAAVRSRGGLEVLFVSVGQGDCTLLRLPDGSAILVDAGGAPGGVDPGARDVVPLLRDLGIRRLAAIVISHPHPDHVLGLAAVTRAIPAERVLSNGAPGSGDSGAIVAALRPTAFLPGDVWERAGVRLEAVGGAREGLGENDASLVLRVVHGDTAFLLPGDLEADGEAAAVAAGGLRADVVKVPHHGSRRSSTAAFVEATGARYAVFTLAAGNRYKFPHAEAVGRWRDAGAVVLRTDEGAIRFLSDGRAVRRMPAETVLDALATAQERL